MKPVPKITIVTPSYNQSQFLEKTILSILDQNYPALEYIIIDGGSTDGSVDIIRKYEKYLHYWVSEKDNGQAHAINKGFAISTGDILNWINSDDRLKPDALNSLLELVRLYPDAGAWVGSCDTVDAEGRLLKTYIPKGLTRDQMANWGYTGHFFQPSCFIARTAWEKYGPLNEGIYTCFDYDLYLRISTEFEFRGVEAAWTEATIHKDAKTQMRIPLMRAEKCIVLVRHGYVDLAIQKIEKAEMNAMKWEKLMKEKADRSKRLKKSWYWLVFNSFVKVKNRLTQ